MRRTTIATTVIAAAASVVLIVPSAQAASLGRKLSGTASCDQGQATLATSVNHAGTERGKVTLTGLGNKDWKGGLQLNPEAAYEAAMADGDLSDSELEALFDGPHKSFVAKHGRISEKRKLRDSRSLDATANFRSGVEVCSISVSGDAGQFVASGNDGGIGVRVNGKPAVQAYVTGEAHHRFRFSFTVRTKAGTRHWSATRIAGSVGAAEATMPSVRELSSFTEASVTVTDLTVHIGSETFKLQR
ncbi:hypothetical protein P5P86_03830 [Nocardioides sp. BP30]|uniref:hypothetical protein n=1 Tax=Nocardioides sp. BP30 TaxID=3036374 RepID=UPI0024691DDD|nr:hypothetical protein [Nocardioides sp. BP30]WGL52959.1 hypothetical protein P5P86_03830 [Nocardioides sp. BP30]